MLLSKQHKSPKNNICCKKSLSYDFLMKFLITVMIMHFVMMSILFIRDSDVATLFPATHKHHKLRSERTIDRDTIINSASMMENSIFDSVAADSKSYQSNSSENDKQLTKLPLSSTSNFHKTKTIKSGLSTTALTLNYRKSARIRKKFVVISVLRNLLPAHAAGNYFDPVQNELSSWRHVEMQKLALYTWRRNLPFIKLHVWMDSTDACQSLISYLSFPGDNSISSRGGNDVACSPVQSFSEEHERPFLDAVWKAAAAEYPGHVLVWLNGDILVTQALYSRLEAAYNALPEAVVIARRTDFNLSR